MTDAPVIFDQQKNAYFSGNTQYRRVSNILKGLQEPFDRKGISLGMAMKKVSEGYDGTIGEARADILQEWDELRDSSIDHGHTLHDVCEQFFNTGILVRGYEKLTKTLKELMSDYKYVDPEVIIFWHKAMIAGRTDLRCKRQTTKRSLVDYFDFKTNERNGIKYDSAKRLENNTIKHYNRMMLPPVAHLEDCNYNYYSLQLSLYAYMDEMELGLRTGKLGLLFLRKNQTVMYFPVPYMRYEAEKIVNHTMKLKALPK